MEFTPYRFFFLRKHNTSDIVSRACPNLSLAEMTNYSQELGQFLFEFKVEDRFDSYTVLKTADELSSFLKKAQTSANILEILFKKKDPQLNDFMTKQNFELKGYGFTDEFEGAIPSRVQEFFEIEDQQFYKVKSLHVQRKVVAENCMFKIYNSCTGGRWQDVRVIITPEGIVQMLDEQYHDFLLFDAYFKIKAGPVETKHEHGINMRSAHRRMKLKVKKPKQFITFLYYLRMTLENKRGNIPFFSSSMISKNNDIQYFVDAEQYYKAVAAELQKAKQQIFICGWWVSPELALLRPVTGGNSDYHLFQVLDRMASNGVKIYMIVFHEPKFFPLDSEHTKLKLQGLHPNIRLERHPYDIIPSGWSHHEKCVIIDQNVALMGGLDLCYGRYDSQNHPISDNSPQIYPGIDYNNARIKDFANMRHPELDLQSRSDPRLPWHDIALKITGRAVGDLTNHFLQYWNFSQIQKKIIPEIMENKHSKEDKMKETINPTSATSLNIMDDEKLFESILTLAGPDANLGQNFQNRIRTKLRNQKIQNQVFGVYQNLFKKNIVDIDDHSHRNYLTPSIASLGIIKSRNKNINTLGKSRDYCQLCRSASPWSIGLEANTIERSIQNAYVDLIARAKYHIYIQNQFFISATGEENSYVKNQVANALYKRIKKAIQHGEKFKVIVFMPLLPGMAGVVDTKCPIPLKLTLHWQYKTISRGPDSLIGRVSKLTENPENYIQFLSLRQHGVLQGKPVTELIYIHTKVMIIDDNEVICGSANINDRSQEGNRDSELAMIFTDGEKIGSWMNGHKVQVNKKAHELRKKLYMEHFGISDTDAEDPLSEQTDKLLNKITHKNTEIYRQLFGCYPDDNLKKLSDVLPFSKQPTLGEYEGEIGGIQGHAVEFPLQFLQDENLYSLDINAVQDIFT